MPPHSPPLRRARRSAALAVVAALVTAGGCLTPAANHGVTAPPSSAFSADSASTSAAPAEASSAPPRPTTWLSPNASAWAHLPPAGSNGGPTKPCAPHVDWSEALPVPPGTPREGGIECSDVVPVRYSVCTPEQVARAWRLDLMERELDAMTGEKLPEAYSVRGYLRRQRFLEHAELWSLRIESSATDGSCAEVTPPDFPAGGDAVQPEQYGRITDALCRGDAWLACCASAVVDGPAEVIYESGADGPSLCVVDPAALQGFVTHVRRVDERDFDRKLPVLTPVF
jgi:hypothetical protein